MMFTPKPAYSKYTALLTSDIMTSHILVTNSFNNLGNRSICMVMHGTIEVSVGRLLPLFTD